MTTTSPPSNNSLNSSGGTSDSNSSLNSTPSVDRYAALKDLDEQLRDAKTVHSDSAPTSEPAGNNPFGIHTDGKIRYENVSLIFYLISGISVNPFKNPFQPNQPPQQQQSFQNWTNHESQSPFNAFESPLNNGFYYNHNMANGIISQSAAFRGKGGLGNPFVVSKKWKNHGCF